MGKDGRQTENEGCMKVGDFVRFAHMPRGRPFLVTAYFPAVQMLELRGMAGQYAEHLFLPVDEEEAEALRENERYRFPSPPPHT